MIARLRNSNSCLARNTFEECIRGRRQARHRAPRCPCSKLTVSFALAAWRPHCKRPWSREDRIYIKRKAGLGRWSFQRSSANAMNNDASLLTGATHERACRWLSTHKGNESHRLCFAGISSMTGAFAKARHGSNDRCPGSDAIESGARHAAHNAISSWSFEDTWILLAVDRVTDLGLRGSNECEFSRRR